ncbi:DUF2069 domain-containing protein [Marinospirillum alkaliphilum]|uniref:Uncharacterized membrane protein n=1 Tax=Marinospirillum alkaliphilum DSM 21637 TaxID=1122209 RepID=A0A1K1XQN9_9GAMM|nr:DUF2069 domain-containing protein [Marinospirillum alkaliphilum]SFX51365.1 Uncharacterized membrane protein [Marinospirillum alkaliphilum DSM 21637]
MKAAAPLPLKELNQKLLISRWLTLGSYFALLAILLAGIVIYPLPEGARLWIILPVLWLPLLVFLPGILKRNPRTHAWLCFVCLVYFMQGVTTFIVPGKAGIGALQALITVVLFSAAMMYGRWRGMELRGAWTN